MSAMGNIGKNANESVLVSVLSGPNIPPYDSLIIDAGKNSGLSVGDRVVYGRNVLIGEVSQLHDRSAKVKLYSGSGVLTDVILPIGKGEHVIARGFGSGNYYLELPSSVQVGDGTILTTPGSDSYMLGKVGYIQIDRATASQKILVNSLFNIRHVEFVRVIKGPKNDSFE